METLVGILVLAAPVAFLLTLTSRLDRVRRHRDAEVGRQIALTDAIHARLGAVVAPVVRQRRAGWNIAVAVPFERPAVVDGVLASVNDQFGRSHYEIVLSRQASPAPAAKASRAVAHGGESLSWT
jgi:hypothetical protein